MMQIENSGMTYEEYEHMLSQFSPAHLMAQQVTTRGAEHALASLLLMGVTPDNVNAMLVSVRHQLTIMHAVATRRNIELVSFDQSSDGTQVH